MSHHSQSNDNHRAGEPEQPGETGQTGAWHRVVIALGSNLGDREETLFQALADLRATEGIRVTAWSSLHDTVALTASGYDDSAPGYLNQVILAECAWQPEALLGILLDIEARHGRTRDGKQYANRTLDLDLIDYDGLEHHTDTLTLPHPRAHERLFVLRPWVEVDPEATISKRGAVSALIGALEGDRA